MNWSDETDDDAAVAQIVSHIARRAVNHNKSFGGSTIGRAANINRDFDGVYKRIIYDYFFDRPKFNESQFERRFRMPRSVFNKIFRKLYGRDIFVRRNDATGRLGIHPLQRIVSALRALTYGVSSDSCDEYCGLSETAVSESVMAFCNQIVACFGAEYLRRPSEDDLKRVMALYSARGFPGCIGCIDCKHWRWENCPRALAGMYSGKDKNPTMVLEAIADSELWIWHMCFGFAGTNNDINILDSSVTIDSIMKGEFPPCFTYAVNNRVHELLYYLADGIYPDWVLFQKTVREAGTSREKKYSALQESVRKDVERAFGVLVKRFHFLDRSCKRWYAGDILLIMQACVWMHNMIVEARRENYNSTFTYLQNTEEGVSVIENSSFNWFTYLDDNQNMHLSSSIAAHVLEREMAMTDTHEHFSLKYDLIEHVWKVC